MTPGSVRGPLHCPKVGSVVTVFWSDGTVVCSTVEDHGEEFGFLLSDDTFVDPTEIDRMVVYP